MKYIENLKAIFVFNEITKNYDGSLYIRVIIIKQLFFIVEIKSDMQK